MPMIMVTKFELRLLKVDFKNLIHIR